MLLFFILAAAAALVIALMARLDIALHMTLIDGHVRAALELGFLFGLVRMRFRRETSLEQAAAALTKKRAKRSKNGRGKPHNAGAALRSAKLTRLSLRGTIGVSSDAFKSIMCAGAVQALAQTLFCALSPRERPEAEITPDFSSNIVCLNLEGMLSVCPAKIIFIIFAGGA